MKNEDVTITIIIVTLISTLFFMIMQFGTYIKSVNTAVCQSVNAEVLAEEGVFSMNLKCQTSNGTIIRITSKQPPCQQNQNKIYLGNPR